MLAPRHLARCGFRAVAVFLLGIFTSAIGAIGRPLFAQSPTTASIAGRIIDERGQGLCGLDVLVTNSGTGISMRVFSRAEGRYRVSGLEVGGPYTVVVRR